MDFLPLFMSAMALERRNSAYTTTLAGTQAKYNEHTQRHHTRKFRGYGNAFHSSPKAKAKEKEKSPGAATVP